MNVVGFLRPASASKPIGHDDPQGVSDKHPASAPPAPSTGQVGIDVPRDRAGTFEPQIVRTRQRRLTGVDEIVLSLYAKGLTTGEISAHFAEIYGVSVSRETISRITDKVIEEVQAWQQRAAARRMCGSWSATGSRASLSSASIWALNLG